MVENGEDTTSAVVSCNPFTICAALILSFISVLAVVILYLFLSS